MALTFNVSMTMILQPWLLSSCQSPSCVCRPDPDHNAVTLNYVPCVHAVTAVQRCNCLSCVYAAPDVQPGRHRATIQQLRQDPWVAADYKPARAVSSQRRPGLESRTLDKMFDPSVVMKSFKQPDDGWGALRSPSVIGRWRFLSGTHEDGSGR